jgi:hypothetical protein
VGRRHPNVYDNEVGLSGTYRINQRPGVTGALDHVVACLAEEARDPLAQQDVVIGHDDPAPDLRRRS